MKRKAKFLAIFSVMSLAAWAGVQTGLAEETANEEASVDAAASDGTEQAETSAPETQPQTQAPETQAPETTPETQAVIETSPETQAPTEAQTTEASSDSETTSTESSSEVITEPTTEAETQTETSASTESETASDTETETASDTETETASETDSKKKKKETEKIDEKAAKDYEDTTGESIYVFGSYPAGNITDNTNEIYDYLRDVLGLNHAAACGVLANIQCESNFNSTAVGDGGTSYGICQWHLGRFSQLISWCSANGYDYHSIQGQMGYLTCELQGGYAGVYQYLLSVPDTSDGAYAAADYWCRYFEIPANVDYQAAMRADLAIHEYYPMTLGTQEEETEEEEEVAVISEEKMEEVVAQASDQLSSLSRLSVSTEETVETEETEAISYGTMSRSEFEETTQEAIAEAIEEYESKQQEDSEQNELDVNTVIFELAQLSTVFATN